MEQEKKGMQVFCLMFVAIRAWECLIGGPGEPFEWVMLACGGVGLVFQSRYALCASLLLSCYRTWTLLPFVWDNFYWDLQTDLCMIWYILVGGEQWLSEASKSIRAQYAWFYLAAGFWKINTAFLDPSSSCGTVFFIQHMARLGLPLDPRMVAAVAPAATVLLELSVGLGMLVSPSIGALLALVLHSGISLTPYPNNISSFSAKCAARLVLFASTQDVAATFDSCKRFLVVCLPVYVALLRTQTENLRPQDWASTIFVVEVFFVAKVLLDGLRSKRNPKATHNFFSALAFFYSFGVLLLGVGDLGQPSMYSNLTATGGSNHLLARRLAIMRTRTDPSSVFYGGIVRVESSDSDYIRKVYPAEYTQALEPSDVPRLMAEAGYDPPRFFHPAKARVLRTFAVLPPQTQWTKFTQPAMEFRRLLAETVEQENRPFTIVYSRLPGFAGDELWRSTAVNYTVTASFDRDGILTNCSSASSPDERVAEHVPPRPCEDDELVFLPPLPYLAQKLMFFLTYPVVERSDGTTPPNILCFGP